MSGEDTASKTVADVIGARDHNPPQFGFYTFATATSAMRRQVLDIWIAGPKYIKKRSRTKWVILGTYSRDSVTSTNEKGELEIYARRP